MIRVLLADDHPIVRAGISYFTFIEPSAKDLDGLAEVIGLVRG